MLSGQRCTAIRRSDTRGHDRGNAPAVNPVAAQLADTAGLWTVEMLSAKTPPNGAVNCNYHLLEPSGRWPALPESYREE